MTRYEFNKVYFGKAIHCNTEEKANHFLSLADSVGYKWVNSRELINFSQWGRFKEETCYEVTEYGLMYDNTELFKHTKHEIIEYALPPKFKVGDNVRCNNTLYVTINGKVGVIEKVSPLSLLPYAVKIDGEGWLWYLTENELEKVEEPAYKEETVDDILEEIQEHQESINTLLNRLNYKLKKGEIK